MCVRACVRACVRVCVHVEPYNILNEPLVSCAKLGFELSMHVNLFLQVNLSMKQTKSCSGALRHDRSFLVCARLILPQLFVLLA